MGQVLMVGGGNSADLDVITADASDVRAGKVIVDHDGEPVTGTLPDRGAWSYADLTGGATIKIPAGIHDGNGTVTAKIPDSLESQTPGTATAAKILTGETAWVDGEQITGTMPDQNSKDSLGGINSSYPNVPIHKGTYGQFGLPTEGSERLFAMRPGKGYWNGESYVGAPAATKTVTPSKEQQTVSPSSGGVLEKVVVGAIPNQKNYGYGSGIGQGDGYYSINALPEGYYWKVNGATWEPEARISKDTLRTYLGIIATNIKKGAVIAGITGTWEGYIADSVDLWKDGTNTDGMTFDSNWGNSGSILWTSQSYAYVTTVKSYNLAKYKKLKVWTWYDSNRTTPETGKVSLMIPNTIPFVSEYWSTGPDFNKNTAAGWTEFDLSALMCTTPLRIRISCGINISHIRLE